MDLTFIFQSYPIPEFQELNYTHSSKFYLLYCVVVSAARKVGVILYYLARKKLIFYANNGIASKDTFARFFAVLNPEEFKSCFVTWVKSLQTALNDIIAIDGKTLCSSVDMQNSTSAIHMVSAFATGARLVLAQQKLADKLNEITAIPLLLNLLSLKGNVITIDAMDTQKAIAKQIHDAGGFYVLALKGNQGTLNEDVRLFLESESRKNTSLLIEDKKNKILNFTMLGQGPTYALLIKF